MLRSHRFILLFFSLLWCCQSRDISPGGKTSGTEYYPLRTGVYWIYSVTESVISQVNGQVTSAYDLKVQITDSIASSGQVMYVLQRFKRADATQPWTALTTWSAWKDQFQAVQQEANTPYVKLAFPLIEGKSWNGNKLNSQEGMDKCSDGSLTCDNYAVLNLGKKFEGTVSYENTVTVIEGDADDPIIGQDLRKSVYAKSIGLIYRESTVLTYCTVGSCVGQKIVETGNILKQTVKEYGGL